MAIIPDYRIKCECGNELEIEKVIADDFGRYIGIFVEPHKCITLSAPEGMKTIDELVEENRQQLEDLHNKFLKWDDIEKHYTCECPICRSLEKGGDCQ